MMTIYPYYNTNILRNLLFHIYVNNSQTVIGITGNKNDGMDYISKYIERTYKFNRLDCEKDNIKIDNNKNYVINNLTKYKEYTQLIHYNPIIVCIDDSDIKNTDDEYKLIPYDIYMVNNKNKEYLIKQLKYKI
jgi:hypothetical protein